MAKHPTPEKGRSSASRGGPFAALAFAAILAGGAEAATPGHARPTAHVEASFDCGEARSKLEKSICDDPALRAADRAVAGAYRQALARVPREWREPLRDSQRSWLAYMAVVCMPGDLERRGEGATVANCRRDEFKDRAKALAATLSNPSGYALVALTTYRARAAPAQEAADGDLPRSAQSQALLLQIARPADPSERRWNAMIAKRLAQLMADETDTVADGGVVIDSATPGFIQATVRRSDERGPGGVSVRLIPVAWSLRLGRELTAADLFGDPAAGAGAVARLAFRQMKTNAAQSGDTEAFAPTLSEIRELVAPMRYWSLTKKGLDLTFDDDNAYGGGHYAAVALSTTVSWSDLAPYLRSDLPLDLRALRDSR